MKSIAIATERYDLHRLVSAAIKDANSQSVSGVERCFDILRYLKSLRLSIKDLCSSKAILPLQSLRDHENPKIRMGVHVLFNSWMKTLYSSGRSDPSTTCDKAIPLNPKKHVVKVCSELKKKEHRDIAAESKKKIVFLNKPDVCKSKQNLQKPDGCKPSAAKPLPMKLSENPRSVAHEAREIKQNLNKTDVRKSVSATSRPLHMKKQPPVKVSKNPKSCPALKKNATEMLELFEIAKKSADVANAKGLLAAKAETSICVDTLSLLISFPISSTATETRRIMDRLDCLTKHKDRKICNSASELLHHWRQSIRDQQRQDSRKTQG